MTSLFECNDICIYIYNGIYNHAYIFLLFEKPIFRCLMSVGANLFKITGSSCGGNKSFSVVVVNPYAIKSLLVCF